MSVHRTLEGGWAECPAPETCAMLFHVSDMTLTEVEATPLEMLLPLFEVVDPPSELYENDSRAWVNEAGQRHRDYGLPAVVNPRTGYSAWYAKGMLHRVGGPALIRADGSKTWYRDGLVHREDGPAIEQSDGKRKWYLNGRVLSETAWRAATMTGAR